MHTPSHNSDTGESSIAPGTPLQVGLAKIWEDCLQQENIGPHDNFFERGGDSLLATHVILRLQDHLQIDLTVANLYDHPTLAQFSTFLQTSPSTPLTHFPRLDPQRPRGPFPLSFGQQRLWFLHQWEPESSAYNEGYFWRIFGALNPITLKDSLQDIVDRHDSFRTSFSSREGIPGQIIDPPGPVSLPIIDLRPMTVADRESAIEHYMQDLQYRPFSLTTGPLYRTMLLQLHDEEYLFLLCIHHILIDGISLQVLFEELSSFYQARINGTPLTLPPLPIDYADYAVWQREVLQEESFQRSLAFWRHQLKNAPPYLNFPTDFPRPTTLTYRGKTHLFTISPNTTQALKTLSRQKGTTLFMTMLAAFQILLWRYTGQRDILVGTPIGGRTLVELERLIGFFANTLVYRTRFTGQPDFQEVLTNVRETCLDAYDHQELPFEKIVEDLIPVRDPSRQPVFQVLFQIFHHDLASQFSLESLKVEHIKPPIKNAKFDLYCKLSEKDGSLRGTLEYLTDIFEPQTIERFVTHYQILLEGLVHNPSHQVSTLPLLTSTEREQILRRMEPNSPASFVHRRFASPRGITESNTRLT